MYLKDMVGKLAIRTAEAFNPEPFPPVHLDFGFPVFRLNLDPHGNTWTSR